MYDNFIAWGQTYGLWVTVLLLCFMLILMKVENKKLRDSVDKLRLENSQLRKLEVINNSEKV